MNREHPFNPQNAEEIPCPEGTNADAVGLGPARELLDPGRSDEYLHAYVRGASARRADGAFDRTRTRSTRSIGGFVKRSDRRNPTTRGEGITGVCPVGRRDRFCRRFTMLFSQELCPKSPWTAAKKGCDSIHEDSTEPSANWRGCKPEGRTSLRMIRSSRRILTPRRRPARLI